MIGTLVNPAWLDENAYVEFLRLGFAHDWDRAAFEFYARRTFHGKTADIGVRAEGRTIAAGVSYCYRQLHLADRSVIDVCVMSAGTTIPSERGRGHYKELLHAGIELSRKKRCAAILGFVTRDNSSGRGLSRLGAYSVPAYYLMSSSRKRPADERRGHCRELEPAQALQWSPHLNSGAEVCFYYPTAEEWLQQFVSRPNPVRTQRLSHDSLALIERVGDTDRLQWLGCPTPKKAACIARLLATSGAAGRKFFMYTLDPLLAQNAMRLGMRKREGLLMVLPVDTAAADWSQIARSAWKVQSGDRI